MTTLPSRHPLESQCWKAIWQALQLPPPYDSVLFPVLPFTLEVSDWKLEIMHHHTHGCRSSSSCVAGFVGYWSAVHCWLFRNTHWQNPMLSAAPLPHTHDLNVMGGKKMGCWELRAGQGLWPYVQSDLLPIITDLRGARPGKRITGAEWEGAVIVPAPPPPPQQVSLYSDQGGHSASSPLCLKLKAPAM